MNELKLNAWKLFRFCESITGINIEEKIKNEPNSFSGTIGSYMSTSNLFDVYSELCAQNYDIAYIKGNSALKKFLSSLNIDSNDIQSIESASQILSDSIPLLKEFQTWYNLDIIKFKIEIFGIPFIKDDEKTEENASKISREICSDCKKAVASNKYFKNYVWKKGETSPEPGKLYDIIISNTIACVSSLEYIKLLKSYDDEAIHCSILFKIEEILEYSYFMIVIQYKDNVYLCTDKISFENPRVATTSRNPSRRRESYWENLYLPYELISYIEDKRKESKDITTKESVEFYVVNLKEFCEFVPKVGMWYTLSAIVTKCIIEHSVFKKLEFVSDHISHLLEDKSNNTASASETYFIDINYAECKKHYEDMIFPETSTEIAKISKTDAITKYCSSTELCTSEEFARLSEWSSKEIIREEKQNILDTYYNSHDEMGKLKPYKDIQNLEDMILSNPEPLAKILFSGRKRVYLKMEGENTSQFGRTSDNDYIPLICSHIANTETWPLISIKNMKGKRYMCAFNSEHTATRQIYWNIYHYGQIMNLLSCERKELPQVLWNYKSFYYIPYYGNSILNNVNPEFLIKDPMSSRYPNRISCVLHICKRCVNKFMKEYAKFDNALIVMTKNGEIKDILNFDEYSKKYITNITLVENR